jgi:hypothetical protein
VPLVPPEGLIQDGAIALLGLLTSQASPSDKSEEKASPFFFSPLALKLATTHVDPHH